MDFERLDAYHIALTFAADSGLIQRSIPKGNSDLVDQFRRASFSIVLNIAEGAGRKGIQDKLRFYAIARGSAMECGALLDIFKAVELVEIELYSRARVTLRRVVAILTALCLSGE